VNQLALTTAQTMTTGNGIPAKRSLDKQQEQKNKKKERYDAIYIYRVSDSATFARVATMYIQISMK
jgi:MFS superfamily sulfate permease-like transporter